MNERDKKLALQTDLAKPYVSKTRCATGVKINDVDALQKFADLIRADEREACAKICDAHNAKENLFAEERYAAHWLAKEI